MGLGSCGALGDGTLDAGLDDSHRNGVAGEPRGVMDVQLLHDTLPVSFDGLHADAQVRSDLLVGAAFGNPLQHLPFA